MNEVIDSIVETISPASIAQATGATQRLLRAGASQRFGDLAEIAIRLCAARHSPSPRLDHAHSLILCADHGINSSGISLGQAEAGTQHLRAILEGKSSTNAAVRNAGAAMMLVDVGMFSAPEQYKEEILSFSMGQGTKDFSKEPAMSIEQAKAAIQTGIALCFSLADEKLELLALGGISPGSELSAAAIAASLTRSTPKLTDLDEQKLVERALTQHSALSSSPYEILAVFGGFEIAAMVGVILAAASIHVPVIIDGHQSSSAALLAHRIKPEVTGYLFASYAGKNPTHQEALVELALSPILNMEKTPEAGSASALTIPLLQAAAEALAAC